MKFLKLLINLVLQNINRDFPFTDVTRSTPCRIDDCVAHQTRISAHLLAVRPLLPS